MATTETVPVSPTASGPTGPMGSRPPPRPIKMDKVTQGRLDDLKAKMQTETETVTQKLERIKEIGQSLRLLNSGNSEIMREREEAVGGLSELKTKIDGKVARRSEILDHLQKHQKQGRATKDKIAAMTRDLGFSNEDEFHKKVNAIERHIMTDAQLTLGEEKKMIAQISQLRQSRPKLGELTSLTSDTSLDNTSTEPLKKELDAIKVELNQMFEEKSAVYEKLKVINEKRAKENEPGQKYQEERKALSDEINEHKAARKALQDEYDTVFQEAKKKEAEARRKQREKIMEEKAKRQQEGKIRQLKAQLENEGMEPFSYKLQDMKSIMAYLKSLISDEKPTVERTDETPAEENTIVTADGEEFVIHRKNADVVQSRGKKGKNKKQKEEKKKLTHDLRTLAEFKKLDIPVPLTVEEIPPALTKIEERVAILEKELEKELDTWRSRQDILQKKLEAIEAGRPSEEVEAIGATLEDKTVNPPVSDAAAAGDEKYEPQPDVSPDAAPTVESLQADETSDIPADVTEILNAELEEPKGESSQSVMEAEGLKESNPTSASETSEGRVQEHTGDMGSDSDEDKNAS